MAESLVLTNGGKPVGTLATYTLSASATPSDPRDGSGQVPTYSAVLTDTTVDAKVLPEMGVTLTDWTGFNETTTPGVVASATANGNSGLISVDVDTMFDKLNTEQTCYPIMLSDVLTYPVQEALEHYALMAGITPNRVEGNILHYIDRWTNIGKMKDSSRVWRYYGPSTTFKSYIPNTPYDAAVRTYVDPIDVNLTQSIVMGMEVIADVTESRIYTYVDSVQDDVRFSLVKDSNSYYLRQKVGSAATTNLVTKVYSPPGISSMYVAVLIKATPGTTDQIDVTMRNYYWDYVTQSTVYSDATTTGIVSYLRNRPKPYQIDIGYDPTLVSGAEVGTTPDTFYVAAASAMQEDIPRPQTAITVAPTSAVSATIAKQPSDIPGFTGNVWEKMRELCAICELDMWLEDNTLKVLPRTEKRLSGSAFVPARVMNKSNVVEQVQNREAARSVEVLYRTKVGVGNVNLMWKADSVYSLDQGETKVETVQTDSTFTYISQPIPVSGVPVPYTWPYGAYVVTGNDGYIVDPQWWKDNGGYIKVEMTGKSGEVKITMQAPTVDTVRAPYRLSEGVADRPALYLTGYGLALTDPTTVTVFTGNSTAAQQVGVTFDSPFITKKIVAFNTGHKLSNVYGTSQGELTYTVPRGDSPLAASSAQSNRPLAESVYWKGSYYRALSQEITPQSIAVSKAERANYIAVLNGEFATGKTIADWNALHAGKTIRETNVAPLPRYEG